MLNPQFFFFKYHLKLAIKERKELGSKYSLPSFFRAVMINLAMHSAPSGEFRLVPQRQKFLKQSNILLSFLSCIFVFFNGPRKIVPLN